MNSFRLFVILTLAAGTGYVNGQPSPLRFRQAGDGAPVEVLSGADAATLGDAMFNLLLKEKANLTKLSDIEAAIQPNEADRRLFVVNEQIVRSVKQGSRRAVLAFGGSNGVESL